MRHALTGLLAAVSMLAITGAARAETFDVLIRGGEVLDGTGLERYAADVGVRGGRIARIGDLSADTAAEVVDARGLFVAPGFINIHDHPEPDAVARAENVLTQGITTEIGNPDGMGSTKASERQSTDIAAQLKAMSADGLAANLGLYIGFNAVWAEVMGDRDHRPTAADMARMRALVAKGLQDGAWGVSAGLDYKPGYFARLDEVVAVVSVAAPWRTDFPNHERLTPETGYSGLAGVRETVEIARRAGLAPVFTHMKAQGFEQGRAQEQLDLIDAVNRSGHVAAGDIYPYTYGFNNVRSLLIPGWALEGGEDALYARFADAAARARIAADVEKVMSLRWNGPSGVYVSGLGRELTDLMAEWKVGAGEAIIRLNEAYRGRLPETYLRFGVDSDVVRMLRHPDVAVACDCGSLGVVAGHPRAFGTFPAVLGRYVRDRGELTWEDAVRKMSGLPASIIGLTDRGLLAVGMAADVTVFDPRTISDRGSADKPELAQGVRAVLVNGGLALNNGAVTGARRGAVILRAADMPTRPFTLGAGRRLSGTTRFADGARLAVELRQGRGRRAAEGSVRLVDGQGRRLFEATALGVLQATDGWASVTGMGVGADGRPAAFRLIVDPQGGAPAADRRLELAIDGRAPLRAGQARGWRIALD